MPDLTGSLKQLFVYAPRLVEPTMVGDVFAPLLRIVQVDNSPGSVREVIYTSEFPMRIASKHINEITIEIFTPSGQPVKFEWGTTTLVLDFRRQYL